MGQRSEGIGSKDVLQKCVKEDREHQRKTRLWEAGWRRGT